MAKFEKDYDLARAQIMKNHTLSEDFIRGLTVELLTEFLKDKVRPSEEEITNLTKEAIRIAIVADKARLQD